MQIVRLDDGKRVRNNVYKAKCSISGKPYPSVSVHKYGAETKSL
jgi:hypothetical protein